MGCTLNALGFYGIATVYSGLEYSGILKKLWRRVSITGYFSDGFISRMQSLGDCVSFASLLMWSCCDGGGGGGGNQRNSPLRYGRSSVTYFRITRGSYLSPLPQSPPLKTKCSLPLLLIVSCITYQQNWMGKRKNIDNVWNVFTVVAFYDSSLSCSKPVLVLGSVHTIVMSTLTRMHQKFRVHATVHAAFSLSTLKRSKTLICNLEPRARFTRIFFYLLD